MNEQRQKKKYYSASERDQHIADWQASGLNQLKYSNANGLNVKTFGRWVRVLNAEKNQPQTDKTPLPPISLMPVKMTHTKAAIPSLDKAPAFLEINLPNGICIRCSNVEDMSNVTSLTKELLLCK